MNNFFASPKLLQHLSSKEIAATGTVRTNRLENAPLQDLGRMTKEIRGTLDVVSDLSPNMTAVRWKDNKIVNSLSTLERKQFNL